MNNKNLIKEYINILIEQEVGYQYPSNPEIQIYLDSDGVLADFDKAIEENQDFLKLKDEYEKLINQMPDYKGLSEDELKKALAGPQTEPSIKALKKAWNALNNKKYILAAREGFFFELEKMPGADDLVNGIISLTGKLPSILTAPIASNKEICEKEKRAWFEKNFKGKYSGFHCTPDKFKYAKPGAVLIDDRTKNTDAFSRAGGHIILYKGNPKDALNQLEEIIKSYETPQVNQ